MTLVSDVPNNFRVFCICLRFLARFANCGFTKTAKTALSRGFGLSIIDCLGDARARPWLIHYVNQYKLPVKLFIMGNYY